MVNQISPALYQQERTEKIAVIFKTALNQTKKAQNDYNTICPFVEKNNPEYLCKDYLTT